MPFPFLPAGAVIAASVLIGALSGFALILRAMDRALVGLRDTALSGLVSGFRTWGSGRAERDRVTSPRAIELDPLIALSARTRDASARFGPNAGRPPELSMDEPISIAEIIDLPTPPLELEAVSRR